MSVVECVGLTSSVVGMVAAAIYIYRVFSGTENRKP